MGCPLCPVSLEHTDEDNKLRSQTSSLDAHSALGSGLHLTPVVLSAIGNTITSYAPVTLEKMDFTCSLLFSKLFDCFPFLVTYFCLSLTAHTYCFSGNNFSSFSSLVLSLVFLLQFFCITFCTSSPAESLGQRKNMFLCPL